MRLRGFSAAEFRNIERCRLSFSPGVNLLYGENAQGKTNVIEGIYLFARGKSFRASERELLRFGSDGFYLRVDYEDRSGEHYLEYKCRAGVRERIKDGYRLSGVGEMMESFHAVLFYPDHLGIVKDGPEERRSFLNVAISGSESTYIKYYRDYKRALAERSCVLKMASRGMPVSREEILAWSGSLAEYSSYVYVRRREYLKRLSRHASRFIDEMTEGREGLSLTLKSDISTEYADAPRDIVAEEYRKIYTASLENEIMAGTTLFGPTRDDIEISLSGRAARHFASQGQQRSIALAMKYAEGEVISELTGEEPIYLFDDVMSELDERRRAFVMAGLSGKQILITSCERGTLTEGADTVIEAKGGNFENIREI